MTDYCYFLDYTAKSHEWFDSDIAAYEKPELDVSPFFLDPIQSNP